MDKSTVITNPFKQKGRGVKVYSSKVKANNPEEPSEPEVQQGCTCSLCRMARGITREVRGQFNKYGKI